MQISRILNFCPYIKIMKRRNFLKSFLATGVMPFIPFVPTFAKGAGVIRPLHEYQSPYSGAAFIARTRSGITPELLSNQMGISAEMAQKAFNVLRHEGVITAPNPLGISKAFRSIGGSDGRTDYINWRNKLKRIKELMLDEQEPAGAEAQTEQIEICNSDNEEENSQDEQISMS